MIIPVSDRSDSSAENCLSLTDACKKCFVNARHDLDSTSFRFPPAMEYFVNSCQQLAISTINEKDGLETCITADYNSIGSKIGLIHEKGASCLIVRLLKVGRRSIVETI